ncbi:MAG: hypothetical protein WB542_04870 [Polaromonas sp.]
MKLIIVFMTARTELGECDLSSFYAGFKISLYIDSLTSRCRFSMNMEVRFEGLETLRTGVATSVDQP